MTASNPPTGNSTTHQPPSDDPIATQSEPTTEAEEANSPNANREAAKYRTRLRQTEGERDALTAQLRALRRNVIEQASGLAKPEALWLTDLDADSVFTAEGAVDVARLAAEVERIRATYGLAAKPRTPRPDPSLGRGHSQAGTTFADAFRPRGH